jgi:hypothetical protein
VPEIRSALVDVAMAVLVSTAIFTDSSAVRAFTLQSPLLVTVWPMFIAAMLSLVTGLILGLGSRYGLVRYWWVAIKLTLNLILSTLTCDESRCNRLVALKDGTTRANVIRLNANIRPSSRRGRS